MTVGEFEFAAFITIELAAIAVTVAGLIRRRRHRHQTARHPSAASLRALRALQRR